MDELLVKTQEVDEKTYKYFYRMTKKEILIVSEVEGIVSTESYGIEIERHDMVNDTLVKVEKDSVYHISPSRHKVHTILTYLFENFVSPIHLIDITGQETDEGVFDHNIQIDLPVEKM